MSFSSLGLSDALVRAVADHGYTQPTPIQTKAIPAVLAGGDLLAGAQTGTGKTAGFVLPLLQRLSTTAAPSAANGRNARKPIRALILTPTRELAAQVEESVRVYGKYAKQSSMVMFGGVGIGPQTAQLRRGVDILVATPGRLLDHQGQGNLDLSHVEILVLDEADRMLDMGFIRDIKRILVLLPKRRQNLLFSATFSDEIRELADALLNSPALIEVAPRNSTVEIIGQTVHPVDRDKKRELLAHLIKTNNWYQVLVFTRTKHGANKLAEQLNRDGITALAIHGNKSQGARTRALAEFKDASLQVLVATDIAARGIDIDELPHVVNYDMPNVPEDYVHRIGRTGRAGATGEAVSLVCVDEHAYLRDIEKLIKRTVPRVVVPGFEPDPNARAQPILQRQGGGQGRNGSAGGGRHGASSGGGRGGGRGAGQGAPQAARGATPQGGQAAPRSASAKAAPRANGGGKPRGTTGNGMPRAPNGSGTAHASNHRGHVEAASAPRAPQAASPGSGGLSGRTGLPPARTNAGPTPAKGRVIARFGGRGR
ncbi:MAG: DEAD/DEAH box helicase [Casimicrobiaceae bacterium]